MTSMITITPGADQDGLTIEITIGETVVRIDQTAAAAAPAAKRADQHSPPLSSGRRSNRSRRPMTPELAAEVKRMAARSSAHQHDIAAHLGINQGRVSEVLTGRRFADVAAA